MGSKSRFPTHAIIATDRSVPSPIFLAALVGVEKILRIDFDTSLPEATFVQQALAKLPEQTIAFGRPTGATVNYAPDRAVKTICGVSISKPSLRQFEAGRHGSASHQKAIEARRWFDS